MFCQFLLYGKVIQLYIYTFFFSRYLPSCSITFHRMFPVLYSRTSLLVHSRCKCLPLLTPHSQSLPLLPLPILRVFTLISNYPGSVQKGPGGDRPPCRSTSDTKGKNNASNQTNKQKNIGSPLVRIIYIFENYHVSLSWGIDTVQSSKVSAYGTFRANV